LEGGFKILNCGQVRIALHHHMGLIVHIARNIFVCRLVCSMFYYSSVSRKDEGAAYSIQLYP